MHPHSSGTRGKCFLKTREECVPLGAWWVKNAFDVLLVFEGKPACSQRCECISSLVLLNGSVVPHLVHTVCPARAPSCCSSICLSGQRLAGREVLLHGGDAKTGPSVCVCRPAVQPAAACSSWRRISPARFVSWWSCTSFTRTASQPS